MCLLATIPPFFFQVALNWPVTMKAEATSLGARLGWAECGFSHRGQKELWLQSCFCAQIMDKRTLFGNIDQQLKLSSRKQEMEIEVGLMGVQGQWMEADTRHAVTI